MNNRIFLSIIELILFFAFLFLVLINYLNNTMCNFSLSDGKIIEINTFIPIIFIYFFGVVSGTLYSIIAAQRYKDQLEFFARKNEKLAQQNEIDTDDKEVLQRKIATLEIALSNALKNKNN